MKKVLLVLLFFLISCSSKQGEVHTNPMDTIKEPDLLADVDQALLTSRLLDAGYVVNVYNLSTGEQIPAIYRQMMFHGKSIFTVGVDGNENKPLSERALEVLTILHEMKPTDIYEAILTDYQTKKVYSYVLWKEPLEKHLSGEQVIQRFEPSTEIPFTEN